MTDQNNEPDVEKSADSLTDVEGHSVADDEGDPDGIVITLPGGICA